MTKKEIFEILKEIDLEPKEYIVVGDASIVCHGIIRNTDIIEIESLKEYKHENIKCRLVKELSESDEINKYFFKTIKKCLEDKKNENNINERSIIKKLELMPFWRLSHINGKHNYEN